MAEQCLGAGLSASEGCEYLHWVAAAAQGQHRVAKAVAGFSQGRVVIEADFFKGSKGIGAQHFGPEVAIVASRVTPGKNVGKGTEEGIFR